MDTAPTHEELLEQAKDLEAFAKRVREELEEFLKRKEQADGTASV